MTTPKSFPLEEGVICLPRKSNLKSVRSLLVISRVPTNSSLVFVELMRRSFSEHHLATRRRSYSIVALAESMSFTGKDRSSLESSTYDSTEVTSPVYSWEVAQVDTKEDRREYSTLRDSMTDR